MPKLRKVKRRKTYKVNVNRKRLRNKLRKLPAIECKDIKEAWEDTKSTKQNLRDMGLAHDANEVLKIPNFKKDILLDAKRKARDSSSDEDEDEDHKKEAPKVYVAKNLEAEAKAPRERLFRLPDQQVQFATYMMDKYGDDYKAMARDKKNYYQMTWRQIRAKINSFKGVPEQYAEYLLKKGEIVLENPEPLEETRKRIAAENVAKHCVPKKKKVKQTASWLKDSVDDFDTEDKLEDIEDDSDENTRSRQKKVKLFSDDESEDEQQTEPKKSQKKNNTTNQTKYSEKKCNSKRMKRLEKSASSDSDSEELEDGEDAEDAVFVDLNDLSDEELSDDDILDNGEFVTDSDEESN